MKITILIHRGVEEGILGTVSRIVRSARAKGHEIDIFAMSAGVAHLALDEFTSLKDDGVNITVCEFNREQYKSPEAVEGVEYGSQYDLAVFASDCDRFISFT